MIPWTHNITARCANKIPREGDPAPEGSEKLRSGQVRAVPEKSWACWGVEGGLGALGVLCFVAKFSGLVLWV